MTSNEGDESCAKESSNQNFLRPEATVVDKMDYYVLGQMLKDLNMEITSIEEDRGILKRRLFGGLNQSFSEEMKDGLSKTVQTYKDSKMKLLNLCSHLERTIEHESFTRNMSGVAEARFPEYRKKLHSFSKMLQKMTDEFEIVVSGETSSGKSTFLNVLLGERILPSDHLRKTASLCRLRYSENKKIEYISDNSIMDKIPLNADCSEIVRRLDSINQDLLSKDNDDHPLTAIDIYWPISSLQKNVVLIDTPGIGEFNHLTKQVLEYIPNCAGYIFIVDSSNAGGVRDPGIRKLIQTIAVSTPNECHIKDLSNTIFVCNKWDKVKTKDRKRVLDNTKTKIGKYFGKLEDWQILQFNADLELQLREWKANPTDNFKKIQRSLNTLMIRTVKIRLGDIYRWFYNFVTEMREFISGRMDAEKVSTDDLQETLRLARQELDIATKELELWNEVEKTVGIKEKTLLKALKDHLETDDIRCKLNEDAPALIDERLEDILSEWANSESGPLELASEEIASKCRELQDKFDSRVSKINNLSPGLNLISGSDKSGKRSKTDAIKHRMWQIAAFAIHVIGLVRHLIPKDRKADRKSSTKQMPDEGVEAKEQLLSEDQLQTFITDYFTSLHNKWLTEIINETKCKLCSASQMIQEMEKCLCRKTDNLAVFQELETELNRCFQCLQDLKHDI